MQCKILIPFFVFTLRNRIDCNSLIKKTIRYVKVSVHNIASIFLSALMTSPSCPIEVLLPNQALYWLFPVYTLLVTISAINHFQNPM